METHQYRRCPLLSTATQPIMAFLGLPAIWIGTRFSCVGCPPSNSSTPPQATGNSTAHPRFSPHFSGMRTVQTRASGPLFPNPTALGDWPNASLTRADRDLLRAGDKQYKGEPFE